MTEIHASHAESSHTRSAPRKHDREKKREKMSPMFFQISGLSSYPLRHVDLFLRIMSIIITVLYTFFFGMIPQKLLTNLEESPWNLSENLRKVTCSSASLCAKQLRSCKYRDSTYKTGSEGSSRHYDLVGKVQI